LEFTRTLPDNSIDTILFSPPYWGLRNYQGIKSVIGQDPNCEHDFSVQAVKKKMGGFSPEASNVGNNKKIERTDQKSSFCSKCEAFYGQLGQEPTWHIYIKNMT